MAGVSDVVVRTGAGDVGGARDGDGVGRWLGIPYAHVTRGMSPDAPESWTGTREATEFGAACPQPAGGDLVPGAALGAPTDEQCLFANVWAPSGDGPHPVLVWIYGGSFLTGAASQPMYDGAALARRGAVVVSLNYRVGPFGFLAPTSELAERGWTANCGLHDVVAGLTWVRREIAAFGGDASNVTVFGESAGAGVIAHLLGAPGRADWFDRAIVQSASTGRTFDTPTATLVTEAYLRALGGIDALFDAPPQRLVDAIGKVMTDPAVFGAVGFMPFHPAVDGTLVSDAPDQAVRSGAHAGADLLVSVTRDEMTLFVDAATIEPDRLRKRVSRYASITVDGAGEVIHRYEAHLRSCALPYEPIDVWGAIYSDREMAMPTRRYLDDAAAHHHAAYGAYVDWSAPPRADGRPLGATHAVDLPFTFSTLDVDGWRDFLGANRERAAAADHLAAHTGDTWVAFARGGDPGWPRWNEGRIMQGLGETLRAVTDPIGARVALWDGIE
jgi:para-nitrobenzyl esterase